MEEINYSDEFIELINSAKVLAFSMQHEYIVPEHLLQMALRQKEIQDIFDSLDVDWSALSEENISFLESMEKIPYQEERTMVLSYQMKEILDEAVENLIFAERNELQVPHVFAQMLVLEDSEAAYLLDKYLGSMKTEFLSRLVAAYN
ncbi:MAG: hypothetical protein K2M39_07525, partial [Muribaculaceae bacterium]|nr:hypothetical protein [Muribaculaceae bacterium]